MTERLELLPSKARAWREHLKLSRAELAKNIGYGIDRIQDFESGFSRKQSAPIGERAWRNYSLACAKVAASLADLKELDQANLRVTAIEDKLIAKFNWGNK